MGTKAGRPFQAAFGDKSKDRIDSAEEISERKGGRDLEYESYADAGDQSAV